MIYTLVRPFADPQMQKLALWVADMMPACEEQAKALMVSTEMIVGQAADEASWGRVAIGHNLFGIKADAAWTGPKLKVRTAEEDDQGRTYFIEAWFRDYPTWKASIDDHFAFLQANSRYADAGVFTAHSDRGYAEALKRGGYATDVNYADKLMKMADSVRLFTARMVTSDQANAVRDTPTPARLLLIGLQGADVAAVQIKLNIPADGSFGPMTAEAVEAFQRYHGLTSDGIVGDATRTALEL